MIQKHATQFATPDDPRFDATDYVVMASAQETHLLWFKWHHFYGVSPWEDDRIGFMRHVASLGERPLWVDVQWALIGGKRIAFASGLCDSLADATIVEDWCCAIFRCIQDADQRSSRRTDAANFSNILRMIQREGNLVIRDFDELRRAVEAVEVKPWR